jgi:hypothetical protein
MKLLCIDVGKSGGIAFGTGPIPAAIKMPDTHVEVAHMIREFFPDRIYIEQVNGYGGNEEGRGNAMFNFGSTYWGPQYLAAAFDIPCELVRPQKWQKSLGLGSSGGDKPEFKRKLKAAAQRLFPGLKPTMLTCDAILIYHAAFNNKL